jgi:hypothetical protein
MPWLTTVERLREQSPRLCNCNHSTSSHEPQHEAVTTNDQTGETRREYLCNNAAARLCHDLGIRHATFNPQGNKA